MIFAAMIFISCQKDNMMDKSLGIDIKKYENQLSIDYSNALLNHNSLNVTGVTPGEHVAHHSGTATASTYDTIYFKKMFNWNDSLFSAHFYEFCLDMMQNSGMVGSSNNMMGNISSMMGGTGDMMNGGTMGGTIDMNEMMSYMDNLNNSDKTMMNPDYMKTDSLMFNQMNLCKMMISQTDTIKSIYGNMQALRKNHKTLHGI